MRCRHADAVSVGWPVLAFCALMAPIAAAGRAWCRRSAPPSASVASGLGSTRTTATLGERRLIGGVATLQIVLTVGLLAGAALLVRTARHLANVRPGYDTAHVLTMSVTAMQGGDAWQRFHTEALERVSALPGVRRAAFAWGLPLTGNNSPATLAVVGGGEGDEPRRSDRRPVAGGHPGLLRGDGHRPVRGPRLPRVRQRGHPARRHRQPRLRRSLLRRRRTALGRSLRFVDNDDRRRSRSSASSRTCGPMP